jgi:alpha-beta hydrolase superfamily lysophospholipase
LTEQVGWVPTRSGAVFAALHSPTADRSGTAVVLIPPFGWEAMAAARNLRGWARQLADAGHAVVRFHLPGQGDSTGDSTTQDLHSWSAALVDLVDHTRAATGCGRVVAIGLGLGGLVALQAVHDGARLDDLVLWATPVKGRLLLREIRAFASMTSEPGDGPTGESVPAEVGADGVLWAHGYPLGRAAQEQLTALDAAALNLRGVQRALVLGRGTLPHDARLVTALVAQGVDAVGEAGPGYDELTVEPRLSQAPTATTVRVLEWLLPGTAGPTGSWPRVDMGEQLVEVGPVSAVLTEATDPVLTAVFLGAGATPRPGPNRLWTEAARRWRDRGVTSLRVDLFGIGEAAGPDSWETGPDGFYLESYRAQVHDVLDEVARRGLPDRLLLVGLCSGGFWAAQAALSDDRVVGAVMLNSNSLVWPPPLAPLGPRERLRHLTRADTWKPLLTDRAARQDAAQRARRSLRLLSDRIVGAPDDGSRRAPANTAQVLRALQARGVPVTVGVSPGEPSLPDLESLPAGSATDVRYLEGPRGAHTLSPHVLRAQAERLLDEVLEAALSAPPAHERVQR